MVPERILDATSRRYDARTRDRRNAEERLHAGGTFHADTPERVQKRLARLSMHAAAAAVAGPAGIELAPSPPAAAFSSLERILGTSDLMSVTFLERAVTAARTVGRVRIRGAGGQVVGFGTGSLVSPRLLITNNHVLGAASEASSSQVEFNFQDHVGGGSAPSLLFGLVPDEFFLTDPDLDYTLVAVAPVGADGTASIGDFGFNRLIEDEGKAVLGEALNIIQHPNGEPKQVALRENQLIDVLELFLHYHTDTAPGSSGSPVFNDQWELVALHHSGVPKRDGQGQLLTVDDKPWTSAMGEHRLQWVANEGARVSRIVQHIKRHQLTGRAAQLRDELFNAAQPGEAVVRAPGAPGSRSTAVSADGTITWTLPLPPLQISLRVGDLAAPAPPAPPPVRPTVAEEPPELRDALAELARAASRPYYSNVKDEQARAEYYAAVDLATSGRSLFTALSALVTRTHATPLAYAPSRHVYPWVDLHEDLKIRSIYSGKTFDAEELIREDERIARQRNVQLQELLRNERGLVTERLNEMADWLEANLPFNCEHVVPQSWFAKREPMRGDLHHLFACEVGCNSFRGNKPYFDFADFEEAIRDECGKLDGSTKFEPSASKGAVARATLYFLMRYPNLVNDIIPSYDAARLEVLLRWHRDHPVSVYERHRNAAIFEKQGNRNPLIDFPEVADQIDFSAGL